MTVRELIKHSDLEFSDIADFIDGSDGFEATRDEMANATGIDHPMIDIDGGTAKGEEILDADIIENTPL